MPVSTYTELRQAIADWLNRADLASQIPDFITLAEATLNRVMRDTRMVSSAAITVPTNARSAAVPADMLEPLYVQTADSPLEQVSPEELTMLRRARLRSPGTPRFFAIVGRNLEVAPVPASTATATMAYFASIPPLASNATNWLLTNNPDVYLYTALMHAAPYLRDDQRAQVLENYVVKQVTAALEQNAKVEGVAP